MEISFSVFQQQTIGLTQGGWDESVPFDQFDPSTGVLLDAGFATVGTVVSWGAIENLAPVAASVSLLTNATIVATAPMAGVTGPYDQVVGLVAPETYAQAVLPAYQGTFAVGLLAEGLTVESFLDTGTRHHFDNGGAAIAAHPNFSRSGWEAGGCAPLPRTGPVVDAVRARIAARAVAQARIALAV